MENIIDEDVFGKYTIVPGLKLNPCPDCGASMEVRDHFGMDVVNHYALVCSKNCSHSQLSFTTAKKAEKYCNKGPNLYATRKEMSQLRRMNTRLLRENAELKTIWHKYPDEKPVNGRFYATKMKNSKDVEAHFWRGGGEYWADILYDDRIKDIIIKKIEDSDITHWAKLPMFSEKGKE